MNRPRVEAVLAEEGLAGVVASAPEHVTYLTGLATPLMYRFLPGNPYKQETLALATGGSRVLITAVESVAELLETEIDADAVYLYGEAAPGADELPGALACADALDGLARAAREHGLAGERVGVDALGLSRRRGRALETALGAAEVVDGTDVLRRMRRIKSATELGRLRTVLQIVERAMAGAFSVLGPGVSEADVAREIRVAIAREGADPGHCETNAGLRARAPFPPSSTYRMAPGDVVRCDCGARWLGYWADTGRSAAISPDAAVRKCHQALEHGMQRALDAIAPGVRAGDVATTAIDGVREAGIPEFRRPHVGHGIGLELYEFPLLTTAAPAVLEAGMVVNVELPYADPRFGGLQLEETVLVRDGGCELITSADRVLLAASNPTLPPEKETQ